MDKQGSARDVILIVIVIFVLALGTFVAHFMMNTAANGMLAVPTINSSSSTVTALESAKTVSSQYDYLVFAVFIGMTLALIITGWFVGGNPIFMFIYFLIVIIGVVLAAIFSNVWEQISQASVFGSTVVSFPITNHLLTWLPMYASIIGILGLIVMFAKPFISPEG